MLNIIQDDINQLKDLYSTLQSQFQNAPTSDARRDVLFALVDLNRKISAMLEKEVER